MSQLRNSPALTPEVRSPAGHDSAARGKQSNYPWVPWLVVLLAVIGLGVVVRFVLAWRDLPVAARIVDVATVVLASAWCYYGLHLRRDRAWAKTQRIYLVLSNLLWLAAFIFFALGRTSWAINLFGIWALVAIGLLGIWFIGAIASAGHPVVGVARAVILQATRLHIVKVTIAAVVLMIILLPSQLDPAERLNYRVSFYLVWSLRLSAFLLSVMTAVLGCYSITNDLARYQMFMVASKPVGRFQYLLGKWLGLALLNLVLCTIVGVGVWLGARAMAEEPLPNPPTLEAYRNREMVKSDVLTARVTAYPVPGPETNLGAMVREEFEALKREFPDKFPERFEDLDEKTVSELRGKAISRWHSIAPRSHRTFVFEGFKDLAQEYDRWAQTRQGRIAEFEKLVKEGRREEAEKLGREIDAMAPPDTSLRLRIKPKHQTEAPDRMVRMIMRVGGQVSPLAPMPNDTVRELPIPLHLVGDDGRVVVSIANVDPANHDATHKSNITFETYEGIELLYTAGTFEGNLLRGIVVHWVRLGFLAMLAITMGTVLGFPMAVLTTIFIYCVAVFSSFASESLDFYAPFSVKDKSKWEVLVTVLEGIWNGIISADFGVVFKLFVKLLGDATIALVPSFSYYNSTPLVADGRMVGTDLVGETILWVGFVWTGIILLIGWLLFRRKELARVTV